MTSAKRCKSVCGMPLSEVSRRIGKPRQTLDNWYKKNILLFDAVCIGSAETRIRGAASSLTIEDHDLDAPPINVHLAKKAMEVVSAIRSINRSRIHAVEIGDDDPAYWQRKEWVDWILDLAYELELEASADYSGV